MKDITKNQIAGIHTALRTRGLKEQKNELVLQYSSGRTESVAKLYFSEAHELLKMLNGQKQQQANPGEKMIRSIIAMAREMGVITRGNYVSPTGRMVFTSDYSRFNQWLLEKSCVKKQSLNKCTPEELNKLVTQYKAIYMDWLKKHH